jgi:hypothetical protein
LVKVQDIGSYESCLHHNKKLMKIQIIKDKRE